MRKTKKKQVKDELEHLKQAENKKRHMEKTLAIFVTGKKRNIRRKRTTET